MGSDRTTPRQYLSPVAFNALVPARFMITVGHLLATIMVSYTQVGPASVGRHGGRSPSAVAWQEDNIQASLSLNPTNTEIIDARSRMEVPKQLLLCAPTQSPLGIACRAIGKRHCAAFSSISLECSAGSRCSSNRFVKLLRCAGVCKG